MSSVLGEFTPKSLDYTSSSAQLVGNGAGPNLALTGACVDGNIYSCQANMLRLYINHAKLMLDGTLQTVKAVNPSFNSMKAGQSAKDETADHDENVKAADGKESTDHDETFDWSMVSETQYKALFKEKDQSKLYLSVEGTKYEIYANADLNSGGTSTGIVKTTLSYTDATHWSVDATIAGMKCNEADPRAPMTLRVQMTRKGTLWTGKAHHYNGIWSYGGHPLAGPENQITCLIEPSDTMSMTFYMEFIGNDVGAKANVYTMLRNKSSLTDIASWGIDQSCPNLLGSYYAATGDSCEAHYADPKDIDLRVYVNPFCNPDSTDIAKWNDNCSSLAGAEEVAAEAFDSQNGWDPPSTFYTTAITVPTSVE